MIQRSSSSLYVARSWSERYVLQVMARVVQFELAARIEWRAFRDPKSERWVGICDSLNVTAEAATWGELEQVINEIHNELFRDLLEEGELQSFLQNHGWKPSTPVPQRAADGDIVFDIPSQIVPVSDGQARAAHQ